jgi:hypothetical protein
MRVRCPDCKGVIHASRAKMDAAKDVHALTCPKPPEDQHSRRGARRTREMVSA